jgi:hypothetical protein
VKEAGKSAPAAGLHRRGGGSHGGGAGTHRARKGAGVK